jgi:hypothetical protein
MPAPHPTDASHRFHAWTASLWCRVRGAIHVRRGPVYGMSRRTISLRSCPHSQR